MLNMLKRLVARRLDYTTRFHLRAGFRSLDYKFLGAVAALVVMILLAMRLY